MAQVDPAFLVPWVRAELEGVGEGAALDARAARAQQDGLDADEAELDAAFDLAARRGLLARYAKRAAWPSGSSATARAASPGCVQPRAPLTGWRSWSQPSSTILARQ